MRLFHCFVLNCESSETSDLFKSLFTQNKNLRGLTGLVSSVLTVSVLVEVALNFHVVIFFL